MKKTGDIDPMKEGMTLREFSDFYLSGRKDLACNSLLSYRYMRNISGSLIDFKDSSISFSKQLAFVSPGELGIKRVKSKNSNRIVPIPPGLCQALKEYRERRVLYFHGRLTHYNSSTSLGIILHKLSPAHTMHDFRHTYATRLLASGLDIKTVASLLGDTISTVEKVYVHYTDEMRTKAAGDINRIFG